MRSKRGTSSSAVLDLCVCVWWILHTVRLILYLCSSVSLSVSHHDESHPPSFNPLIWTQPEREEQNVPLWSAICMFTFINTDMNPTKQLFRSAHILSDSSVPKSIKPTRPPYYQTLQRISHLWCRQREQSLNINFLLYGRNNCVYWVHINIYI